VHVHLEILTANTLSEVALIPQASSTLNGGVAVGGVGVGPSTPTVGVSENLAIQCYDRDKQAWTLEVIHKYFI
jgi:hypothetical protein